MASGNRLHSIPLLIAVLVAACANNDERQYPVTEAARPFHALSAAEGTAPPVARDVTFERLKNARNEPRNWMTYYGAYDGQRYSALEEIDSDNVSQLETAWTFQFGQIGLQASAATFAFERRRLSLTV